VPVVCEEIDDRKTEPLENISGVAVLVMVMFSPPRRLWKGTGFLVTTVVPTGVVEREAGATMAMGLKSGDGGRAVELIIGASGPDLEP